MKYRLYAVWCSCFVKHSKCNAFPNVIKSQKDVPVHIEIFAYLLELQPEKNGPKLHYSTVLFKR